MDSSSQHGKKAQPAHASPPPHHVVALAYDGLCIFELSIAIEVFALPRPELDPWYSFEICSMDPGPLQATGGIRIEASDNLEPLTRAGTIVLPGWRDPHADPPEPVLQALRQAHARGARLVSICSGAFVLAATGLLDGRRATTHWRYADTLAARFPRVEIDPDVLFVGDGSLLTSAGSAAGIDLCLHLVRSDLGAEAANTVARRLVIPPHRDGGQAQFIETPVPIQEEAGFAKLLDRLRGQLEKPHTTASMAALAKVSPRTLARRFEETLGTSPHRWLTRERIVLAQRLLETTDHDIERIATLCGLGSAQLLRLHFRRIVGTTPSVYRRRFQLTG